MLFSIARLSSEGWKASAAQGEASGGMTPPSTCLARAPAAVITTSKNLTGIRRTSAGVGRLASGSVYRPPGGRCKEQPRPAGTRDRLSPAPGPVILHAYPPG